MTPSFDNARPRPVPTALDALRPRIEADAFDVAVFRLETVATDLGYGDIRPLPGALAWIGDLRELGKRTALVASGQRVERAMELAGIRDCFDLVVEGARGPAGYRDALEDLSVEPGRALAIEADAGGIAAAREAGLGLTIGVARDGSSAEQLRRAGADAIVADLQELLGPLSPMS
jgi:beta-phosphoglucomutase-like phosphatase (HAD superfamily)